MLTSAALVASIVGIAPHGGAAAATTAPPAADRHGRQAHVTPIKGHGKVFDLRALPQDHTASHRRLTRPIDEEPETPRADVGGGSDSVGITSPAVPAPPTSSSFEGLHYTQDCNGTPCGAGHPPDTNGDVGPTYYIETVNTAIGVFDKATGANVAAVTFDSFMSQGNFGNVCDTDNFGDPVVLYDSFEDRWVITDFAFKLDSSGNVVNPPGSFECIAVSKTGDPVAGGWNFYSVNTAGGLGDYPKLGIWPDGIYMSVNMFGYAADGGYQGPRVYAFDKAKMYAGAPTVPVVSFDGPADDFTLLPSNARLQSGTPPAGTPNYFVSTWLYLDRLTVYKFHVDWDRPAQSTFTGPDLPLASSAWPNADVPFAPTPANSNDPLGIRAMVQNQYSNIGGVESLWDVHTVRRANTTGSAAPRYYQVDVTGGTVAANLPQAATWDPDGANTNYRYLPSLAVDRAGDLALGYTMSSSTTNPSLRYAGRLAGDPVDTFSQTEQVLIDGTGAQSGNCGGSPCTRWGDYSAMTLDPDGCTFWYTNEYYVTNGLDDHTRIGSFKYPSCTSVGSGGTVSGTVKATATGLAVPGATVTLGSRTTKTATNGTYTFAVPAGTYPSLKVTAPGYEAATVASVAVGDGAATPENFSLVRATSGGGFVDTTQQDFLTGTGPNVDLTTSAGDVLLTSPDVVDQKNTTVTNNGFGFNSTTWAGQTFQAGVTGKLASVDLDLFCSGCTGTTPNITVALRATTGSPALPTGGDLASATIPGFSSGSGGYFKASFASPATVTAGTTYAIVFRATSNPSTGTYAYLCSCTTNSNPYAPGQRVTSSNSGGSWTADTTNGGRDLGFVTRVNRGYTTSATFTSGPKDANPALGEVPTWDSLAWSAGTPAGTGVTFQAAASDSRDGPYSFVGPDGTSATTFSNGASLTQFDGKRYLEYRATLTTADTTVTPSLHDVSVGFRDRPTLSIGSARIVEGDTGSRSAVFSVTIPGPSSLPVSASWSTSDGTAAAGKDFTAASGTVTIPVGAVRSSVSVSVTGEAVVEPDETFTVTLSSPVNAALGSPGATGTILDDDSPANPQLSIGDVSVPEGDAAGGKAAFAVTLDQPQATPVTAQWATAPATASAPSDFRSASGTVSIPAGKTTATIMVTTIGDTAVEADEDFTVTLTGPVGAALARPTGTATLLDDDTTPNAVGLSVGDVRLVEGDAGSGTATFSVRLAKPLAQTVTASYATASGTATGGTDFTSKSGTVTIPAGAVTASIAVVVKPDAIGEGDETFTVTLSGAVNAALVRETGTGTIVDDDSSVVTIGVGDATVGEGNTTARIVSLVVTLSQPASTDTTVHWATVAGTASTSDFSAASKDLVIPAGSRSGTIVVSVKVDIVNESDESFTVVLSSPSSGTLGRVAGAVTIIDDD